MLTKKNEGGKPWRYRLPADAFKDIDRDDVLTLSARQGNGQPLPPWLTFDAKTGEFNGVLPKEPRETQYDFVVTATDKAGAKNSQRFILTSALRHNKAPEMKWIPPQTINEKSSWRFSVADVFRDPYGEILIYTTYAYGNEKEQTLPKWMHFDAKTLTYSGTPENDDAGEYQIRIIANNPWRGSASEYFTLKVNNVNDAPQIHAKLENQEIKSGQPIDFQIPSDAFIDIDKGDKLALKATTIDDKPLPAWLKFDAATGRFSGIPPKFQTTKRVNVKITATDKENAAVSQSFDILIKGTGRIWKNHVLVPIAGTDGDDKFIITSKSYGVDYLIYGEGGNDQIYGGVDDDYIHGGTGNDFLSGGPGSDTYYFEGNFGQDNVYNLDISKDRMDTLVFTNLKREDVTITRNGNHLIIKDCHSNNQVTVQHHFNPNGGNIHCIDEIRFADGSTLDYDAINRLVQSNNNPPRANLAQDRYAAEAARQAQVMMQAMAASGAQPLDKLMTPDNPPLVPPLLPNLKP